MPIPVLLLSVGTSVGMRLAMKRVLDRTGASASGSSRTIAALRDIANKISQRDRSALFDYIARGLESLGRASNAPTEELRKNHLQRAHDQFQMAAGQSIVAPSQLIAGLPVARWMALAKIGQSAVFAARAEEQNFANVMAEAKELDPRIYDLFIDAEDRTATLTSLLNTSSKSTPPPPDPSEEPGNLLRSRFAVGVGLVFVICLIVYIPRWIPPPPPPPRGTTYQVHGQTSATSLGSQVVTIHAVAQGNKAGIYYENQGPAKIHVVSTFQCASPPATCEIEDYPGNQADFTVGANAQGHIVVDNADPTTLSFDSTISIQD